MYSESASIRSSAGWYPKRFRIFVEDLMDQKPITKCSAPRFAKVARIAVAFSLSFFASSVFAQDQAQPAAQPAPPPPHLYGGDQYVGHFLIYTGGMVLDSPKISLTEPGIHVQTGMRWS